MLDYVFPLQSLAIAGLLVLAVYRGNSFPLLLVSAYAAFFALSWAIEPNSLFGLDLRDNERIAIGGSLTAILAVVGINSKRRRYVDLFSLLMILAIINYCLILFANIFLAPSPHEIVEDVYSITYIYLGTADVLVMIGVINGANSDRVYTGFTDAFYDAIQRSFARMESPQTYHWPTRPAQTQKRDTLNAS